MGDNKVKALLGDKQLWKIQQLFMPLGRDVTMTTFLRMVKLLNNILKLQSIISDEQGAKMENQNLQGFLGNITFAGQTAVAITS